MMTNKKAQLAMAPIFCIPCELTPYGRLSVDMVFRLSPKQHALLNPLRNGHNCLGVPHVIAVLHCYWPSSLALFPTPPDNKQDRRIVD